MAGKWVGLLVAIALATTLIGATVALGSGSGREAVAEYLSTDGDTYIGLRATAVGLPQIGIQGTVGASELPNSLVAYHDSGRYARDLQLIAQAAKSYLRRRLDDNARPARRVRSCKAVYRRIRSGPHRGLYKRRRACKTTRVAPERLKGKAAIVLDIDETTLSNYDGLFVANFTAAGLVLPAALGSSPAIQPTLDLYKYARSRGVAVFFITGRPELSRIPTEANLKRVGFTTWNGLSFKPSGIHTIDYKTGQRNAILKKGYDIIANVGDQESDLDGANADRAFKYANPFYFISD